MKRYLLTAITLFLALAAARAQECRTIADFLNDKNAKTTPSTVKGVLVNVSDMKKLSVLIEDETGKMNVRLVKEEDPLKKFGALDARPGDTLTVTGVLSTYRAQRDTKKAPGMVQATIIATADAPGHDDVIPFPFAVDTEPSFNGDSPNAFATWVNQQLVYPEESRRMGYEGTVYLSFTVYADGTVHDVEVMDSAGDDRLDAEAVRVVSRSPRWTPATIDKKPVKYRFRFPVIFALKAR